MESKLSKIAKPCIWCGYKTHLRLNSRVVCCKEHFTFHHRKTMRKYHNIKTKFICSECNKKYYISSRGIIKYINKCSKKCAIIGAEKVRKELAIKNLEISRAINNSYRIMSDKEKDEFVEQIRQREMSK